ncbi:MAG: bifunctional ornithine acetyltransferase/N-acetylglutamate synthase, partial [Bacillota bacterium]
MTTLKKDITILESGDIATPKGFEAGGLHAGIRKKKLDLAWLYSDVPAVAAGVYTLNSFQAAPLKVTQESINVDGKIQALIVNSGVANACTGEQGDKDALKMRDLMSEQFGVLKHHVAVASTGVIGELLPMDKIKVGITEMDRQTQTSDMFETAILTTDTKEKRAAVQIEIEGETVTIAGAAKGSGMINPNMATMLSFITTDANIEKEALDQSLKAITNQSFNMITVDGDTSTNDMVLVLANGKQHHTPLTTEHADYPLFEEALTYVCQTLAKEIARDGEGATKLIEV